jgi:DNA-binding transcriptional ArsR family regulator
MEEASEVIDKLDRVVALLKIIAAEKLQELKRSVISTRNKERIYELCTGDNEMSEIARKVDVSGESVRLTIRDFEDAGLIISQRRGKKVYPKRVL